MGYSKARYLADMIADGGLTTGVRMRKNSGNNKMKFYKFVSGVETATAVDLDENSTDDLSEGSTNIFYTDTRVGTYLTSNSYATQSYVTSAVSGVDNSDEITEGSTNLYFTNTRARAAVSGTGSLTYNSSTGAFDYTQRTAAEILTALLTVDGSGSGLDADLLDGLNSTQLLRSDADDTVGGNLTMTKKLIGFKKNWATAEGWSVSTQTTQTGYHGGNFSIYGDGNAIAHGIGPDGKQQLVWTGTNNDTAADGDGGWTKGLTNLPSANSNYMSVVYVKRTSSSSSGNFYHGCDTTGNTLNLSGSSNTNPYFNNLAFSSLPLDVWCVSIGYINGYSNAITTSNATSGIFRLDTGAKINTGTDYKMASGVTTQVHRTFLDGSTTGTDDFVLGQPGFWECNGTEPTIEELSMGTRDKINVYDVSGVLLNAS